MTRLLDVDIGLSSATNSQKAILPIYSRLPLIAFAKLELCAAQSCCRSRCTVGGMLPVLHNWRATEGGSARKGVAGGGQRWVGWRCRVWEGSVGNCGLSPCGLMAPTLCPGSSGACCKASWCSLVSCGAGTKKHEGHDRLVACLTPAILEAAGAGTEPGCRRRRQREREAHHHGEKEEEKKKEGDRGAVINRRPPHLVFFSRHLVLAHRGPRGLNPGPGTAHGSLERGATPTLFRLISEKKRKESRAETQRVSRLEGYSCLVGATRQSL